MRQEWEAPVEMAAADDEDTVPVEVHDSPLPDQLWAALRQIAPPVMAFLLARGYVSNDLVILLGIAGGILWPIVAGQLKTRKRSAELRRVAADPRVPDAVAVVKTP